MTSFFSSPRSSFCCCCCRHNHSLCSCCRLCFECCLCPPPPPLPCLPQLPCLPSIPPLPPCSSTPIRVIREQIMIPCPYPVYPSPRSCCECEYDEGLCYSPCNYTNNYGTCQTQKKCSEDYHFATPHYPCLPNRTCTCLPWPRPKRIHLVGQSIVPGYAGHVPGKKFHAAGRTFGKATKDTRCIMSQWEECCPRLPSRIWEQ